MQSFMTGHLMLKVLMLTACPPTMHFNLCSSHLSCWPVQAIKKEAGGSLMDAVIHDGAPNVGGAWASEAYSQSWLVLESLKLACDFLAPRGTFVTKIFR